MGPPPASPCSGPAARRPRPPTPCSHGSAFRLHVSVQMLAGTGAPTPHGHRASPPRGPCLLRRQPRHTLTPGFLSCLSLPEAARLCPPSCSLPRLRGRDMGAWEGTPAASGAWRCWCCSWRGHAGSSLSCLRHTPASLSYVCRTESRTPEVRGGGTRDTGTWGYRKPSEEESGR